MNAPLDPQERLRALRDSDRWAGVRVPRAARAESAAPRRVARFAPAVAALAIAVVAVAGIGVAFASIPHAAAPATGSSTTPASSTSPAADGCTAARVTVALGQSAPLSDYFLETLTVENSGAPCALPAAAFTIGGIRVGNGWGVIDGAVTVPKGESQLYLQAARVDDGVARIGPSPAAKPSLVTLRLGDTVRSLGAVAFSGSWADPVLGQVYGGQILPPAKLAITAAEYARVLAARATAKPKPAYTPPPSTPTVTPPVPTVACTADQLTVTHGDFGGAVGNWVEALIFENHGDPCFLLPGQFSVGTQRAAGGNAARFSIEGGRTILDVMAPDACYTKDGTPVPSPTRSPQPIELTIGGTARQVGTFDVVPCSRPFIDPL